MPPDRKKVPARIFDDQVALITGAGSSIGLATAKSFAEAGAAVVIADRDGESARSAAAALSASGHSALAIRCDVAVEREVEAMIDRVVTIFGRIDVAFNHAGLHVPMAATAEALGDDFDYVHAVNLRGLWSCMKYELQQMQIQGRGSIVNCASQSALVGTVGHGAYSASKHGVLGLTRSAALEYAAKGIRINAVCPGSVHASTAERALIDEPEAMDATIDRIPLGRLGHPDEIASAVVWLSGPGASFVIGHALVVDGGYTVA